MSLSAQQLRRGSSCELPRPAPHVSPPHVSPPHVVSPALVVSPGSCDGAARRGCELLRHPHRAEIRRQRVGTLLHGISFEESSHVEEAIATTSQRGARPTRSHKTEHRAEQVATELGRPSRGSQVDDARADWSLRPEVRCLQQGNLAEEPWPSVLIIYSGHARDARAEHMGCNHALAQLGFSHS